MSIRVHGRSVLTYDEWVAETSYSTGDYVTPTVPNNKCYRCTAAGVSGLTEPTWNPEVGATVEDGSVVWTCEDYAEAPNPLTIELNASGKGGLPHKEIWVKSNSVEKVDFIVYGSYDGVNWRQIDEIKVPHARRDNRHKGLQNAYPFIRVSVDAQANNEIEIVAGE